MTPHPNGLTAGEMIDAIVASDVEISIDEQHLVEDVAEVLTRGGCPSIVDVDRLRKLYDRVKTA